MSLISCIARSFLLTSLKTPTTSPLRLLPKTTRVSTTSQLTMAPSKDEKAAAKKSSSCSSQELQGEKNEWKFRAPYKVHSNDDGGAFKALYEGGCHCGRVKYQLGREKPLDAKFCHCTTCQVLHGMLFSPLLGRGFGFHFSIPNRACFDLGCRVSSREKSDIWKS